MDVFSKEKRSEVMRCITSKNTTPEIAVRKILHSLGYRFRLNRTDLAGKPDIVLPKHKTVIFVHGCFWHCHTCKDGRRPLSNRVYWDVKLDRNKKRDRKCRQQLRRMGWSVVVVWACRIKNQQSLSARLHRHLSKPKLPNSSNSPSLHSSPG